MFTHNALLAETGKLQKFALRLTRNNADADDLLQSTCLRALEKADYFEEGTNLFSWTSKIMYNLFVADYHRRTKFETQYDPENYIEREIIEPTQNINAEFADVNKAMMEMSPEHRIILVSVCVKGMSYAEVSEMLQIPVGTVRSRLSRAREQLHAILDTPFKQKMLLEKSEKEDIPPIPAYIAGYVLQKRVRHNV